MRFFNTAGPVNCQDHYCIPPLTRFNLPEILMLIKQKKYFVLHAPRQSGKTSCMLALRDYLNHEGRYQALYINVEVAQTARNNVGRGIKAILSTCSWIRELIFRSLTPGKPGIHFWGKRWRRSPWSCTQSFMQEFHKATCSYHRWDWFTHRGCINLRSPSDKGRLYKKT